MFTLDSDDSTQILTGSYVQIGKVCVIEFIKITWGLGDNLLSIQAFPCLAFKDFLKSSSQNFFVKPIF